MPSRWLTIATDDVNNPIVNGKEATQVLATECQYPT